jgi:hypothetical protein
MEIFALVCYSKDVFFLKICFLFFSSECSICNEQSSNNMSFIAHLCSHFEDDLNYISPFDKIYRQCSVCHDEFSTPYQTFLHKDQEHMIELNEFRCRICQQNHPNLIDLIAHLNSIHVGLDMPYYCDRCHYRTSMYEDLAYHIRQVFHKLDVLFFLISLRLFSRYIKVLNIFFVPIVFNPSYYHLYLIQIY